MNTDNLDSPLQEVVIFRHATLYLVKSNPQTGVIEATRSYIPIEQFKEIFLTTGKLVKEKKLTRLIFDKRELSVFHQPSMEWYFVEWKEKMFELGLKTHIKILPNDEVFRQSVEIGRDKINKSNPNGKFHIMDIRYAETLDEAIRL